MPERRRRLRTRGRGDSITQPADLAGDALVAPTGVLAGESKDQLANLGRQGRPSRSHRLTTEGGPTPPDKSSVPTDDSFRRDDQLRPGIALNAAQERGQDQPIARPEAGWSTCRWRTRSWCRRTRSSASRSSDERLRPVATRTSIRTRRQA